MIEIETKKLYLQDSYIKEFHAKVLDRGLKGEEPYIVLDQTAFYPEGGGQPWDQGVINDVKVFKVLEEDGVVYHYTEKNVEGENVHGKINWARRFDHMQQHLGQHVLSGAFEQVLDGETVGFHLGQDYVTIDIALEKITQDQLHKVEDLTNEIIYKNLEVKTYIVDKDDVKDLPMRKPPKVEEDIRIVEVSKTDYSGCGGTHPRHTGEVGLVKITKVEKSRGNTRVEFLCGTRALRDYRVKNQIILDSSSMLSRSYLELKDGLAAIQQESKELTRETKLLKQSLSQYKAKEYYASAQEHKGVKLIKEIFSGEDISTLATSIVSEPNAVVLLANKGEKSQLLFTCSKDVNADMNSLLKEILPMINGTGGGNKFRAQGGALQSNNLEEALETAAELLVAML